MLLLFESITIKSIGSKEYALIGFPLSLYMKFYPSSMIGLPATLLALLCCVMIGNKGKLI